MISGGISIFCDLLSQGRLKRQAGKGGPKNGRSEHPEQKKFSSYGNKRLTSKSAPDNSLLL